MAINIKDPATDGAARELAALTGETLTEAVRAAIMERHDRMQRMHRRRQRHDKLQAYITRARALPVLDDTPIDDLLYDEDGLPK